MNRLAHFLDSNAITQTAFAARIRVDQSRISKLRRGVIRPSLKLATIIERETAGEVPATSWFEAEGAAQ